MSTAPKYATHYLPVQEGHRAEPEYWRQDEGCPREAFCWADTEWIYMGSTIPEAAIPIKRDEPVAWDGQGLPPVGTVCEGKVKDGGIWEQYIVKAVTAEFLIAECDDGKETPFRHVYWQFRPIRTPEQIAAEERRGHIATLVQHICADGAFDVDDPEVAAAAAKIYDAGYRKQEATQ